MGICSPGIHSTLLGPGLRRMALKLKLGTMIGVGIMKAYTVYTSYKNGFTKQIQADSMKQAVCLALATLCKPMDEIHFTHGVGIQSQPAYYHVNGYGKVGVYHDDE